ncbi:molecular chaperone [Citrobacter amalonaticus]|nr:molecular chaperone [Citrobacter amalonaticus]
MRLMLRLFVLWIFGFAGYANAGVILTGTRIIYPEGTKDKTLQLTNQDSLSYIVQVQIDNGSPEGFTPFVLTPPVFRMEPHSGQSVRLSYSGEPLPGDRESVFYFNFSQLPLLQAGTEQKNKLILAITNRVKVFYRPAMLSGHPEKTAEHIHLRMEGKQIRIVNQSEYHASVRRASLVRNGKEIQLAEGVMISPKSSMVFTPSSEITGLSGAHLRLVLVNDYGVDIVKEHRL